MSALLVAIVGVVSSISNVEVLARPRLEVESLSRQYTDAWTADTKADVTVTVNSLTHGASPGTGAFIASIVVTAPEGTELAGFYYNLDELHDTLPSTASPFSATGVITVVSPPVGDFWFHVRVKFGDGSLSPTTHAVFSSYRSTSHPDPVVPYYTSEFEFEWNDYWTFGSFLSAELPVASGYVYRIDDTPETVLSVLNATFTTENLLHTSSTSDGDTLSTNTWYLHFAAVDQAQMLIEDSVITFPFQVYALEPGVESSSHPQDESIPGTEESLERDFTATVYAPSGFNWATAAAPAPWGQRLGYSVAAFKDRLWVMGGTARDAAVGTGDMNDIWSSADGTVWELANDNAAWSPRQSHSVVVFQDKLWLIGGYRHWDSPGEMGDVWFSEDGTTWTLATERAPWWGTFDGTPIVVTKAIVFDEKLLVTYIYYGNGIWASTDGVSWETIGFRPDDTTVPVAFDGVLWAFGYRENEVFASADGSEWTAVTGHNLPNIQELRFNTTVYDQKLWIFGTRNRWPEIWWSENGKRWNEIYSNTFSLMSGSLFTNAYHWTLAGTPEIKTVFADKIWAGWTSVSGFGYYDAIFSANAIWYRYVLDRQPNTLPDSLSPISRTGIISAHNASLGSNFLHVAAVDPNGNVTSTAHYEFVIKQGTPQVISNSHPDPAFLYPERDVELTWNANGIPDVVGYYRTFDNNPGTVPTERTEDTEWVVTNVGTGNHWAHIQAEDKYGNKSLSAHFQVNIAEARGPEVSLAISSNGQNLQFTWTDPDSFADGTPRFYWEFDQSAETVPTTSSPYTSEYLINRLGLVPGVYFFHIRGRDSYGNLSMTSHIQAIVGNNLLALSDPFPTATAGGRVTYRIVYPGATSINLSEDNVSLVATGSAAGNVRITNDFFPSTRNIEIESITGDGTIRITVDAGTATYSDGSTASAITRSTAFTVDNSPPALSIGEPTPRLTSSGPVTYPVQYSGSPTLISLRPGDVHLLTTDSARASGISITGDAESRNIVLSGIGGNGTIAIEIVDGTARDLVDNVASGAPGTPFTVDNARPVTVINGPTPSLTGTGPVSWGLTYSEPVTMNDLAGKVHLLSTGTVTAELRLADGPLIEALDILGDGTLAVSIDAGTARDGVGNLAFAAGPSLAALIDNSGPIVTIGEPIGGSENADGVAFPIRFTDESSFTVTLTADDVLLHGSNDVEGDVQILDGKAESRERTVKLSNISGHGTLAISLRAATARDSAGNPSAAAGPSAAVEISSYFLTAVADPPGSGEILLDPPGGSYSADQVVSVSPMPNLGWRFDHWSGDATSDGTNVQVVMNGNKRVVGHFIAQLSLTVAAIPPEGGSTTPEGTQVVDAGTVVVLSATANPFYRFSHWEGPVDSPASAITTVAVHESTTVSARFLRQYTLTMAAEPTDGGATTPAIGPSVFDEATVVNVSARPTAGQAFYQWNGEVADPFADSTTTVMNTDKTLVAQFGPGFALTILASPPEGGTTIPAAGVHAFPQNVEVEIEAIPAEGWEFDSWNGPVLDPLQFESSLTLSADTTVTASFRQILYALQVSTSGQGTVVSDPSNSPYAPGTEVTLTAQPASGWRFDRWQGAISGTENPARITLTSDAAVSAVFVQIANSGGSGLDCFRSKSTSNSPALASADLGILGLVVGVLLSARSKYHGI